MIGIYSNPYRDKRFETTKRFIELAKKAGIEYRAAEFCDKSDALAAAKTAANRSALTGCALIVVFGGDGTILGAATGAGEGVPLLGVNMGKLGFLTEASDAELELIVGAIKDGAYTVEERMMLEARLKNGETYAALNEIAVKDDGAHMAHMRIYIDGAFFDEYAADGVLIATPTGSTAYSLSAGGPILAPDVSAFIVNPINPHTLHSRPFVLSDGHTVGVETTDGGALRIIADGVQKTAIGADDFVIIQKSDKKARFVRIRPYDFYSAIANKFNGK
ncbi:MAG: NAD(+)/NADH kinase [Clostridiales bacterium]|jgi:NAD+ kinase|nr:NAD(+)/NADH kinase [Clostridiales bacterium]